LWESGGWCQNGSPPKKLSWGLSIIKVKRAYTRPSTKQGTAGGRGKSKTELLRHGTVRIEGEEGGRDKPVGTGVFPPLVLLHVVRTPLGKGKRDQASGKHETRQEVCKTSSKTKEVAEGPREGKGLGRPVSLLIGKGGRAKTTGGKLKTRLRAVGSVE